MTGQCGAGKSLLRCCYQFVALTLLIVSGCERSPAPEFRFNAVELLKQERLTLADGEHFDPSYRTEIGSILTALFGTPEEPKFPYLLKEADPAHDLIDLGNLRMAAGPVNREPGAVSKGLYREHCAHCHGITGDGAGPTAAALNPYPRDFRLGKFKFKSTPLRQPPTDADLNKILVNGIPGTAMPSFRTLSQEELEALIDYVKYLTIRGQFEYQLLAELPSLDGGPFFDFGLIENAADGEEPSEEQIEEFEDQLYAYIGDGLQEGIIDRWLKRESKVTTVPSAPPEFDPDHVEHEDFVAKGRTLFFSTGNCMQCHGQTAIGDGQLNNFDDWTNQWIKSANVDPYDQATYQDFLAIGALQPRSIKPRNLHLPIYRGGSRPQDIFLRLVNGIEGTPMPASAALSSDEIWSIVAYVLALPYQNRELQSPIDRPVNDQQIIR